MPDAETQHEISDTNCNVAIQCNSEIGEKDVIITDILLHPESTPRLRFITTTRRRAIKPLNTTVSEVNVVRFAKRVKEKGAGTYKVACSTEKAAPASIFIDDETTTSKTETKTTN